MKWALITSIVCFGLATELFFLAPKAGRKGYGQIVSFMSLVLFLFAIGYFVVWLLRKK